MSEEARQAASERAKRLHAEGRFGGAKFGKLGGRPRKARVTEKIADAANQEAEKITRVFKDAIDPAQPMSIRLKGAQIWTEISSQEAKIAIQEEDVEGRQHSREELIEILASKLTSGPTAQILRRQLEEESIQDAEVVEDDDDAQAA
jgi:hypothetical protein